ncbi:MAG: sigma-70 family RNA polymerase sigma factor [Sandaracinaceae bacterium]
MTSIPMFDAAFTAHRATIFGLCYRMTGSAADADDLVQATFERLLEKPPSDLDAPLRPWLCTVATRLSIDALRKRRRESYFGPWLPGPVETSVLAEDVSLSPEARYGALESATLAFLLALEVLDERQRAVLVLRDVFGMSGPEVAGVLETSPGNVRVLLHRARAALAKEDPVRPVTKEAREETSKLMQALLFALSSGDTKTAMGLLATDSVSMNDGGGEYIAAVVPVRGPEAIARLYRNIQQAGGAPSGFGAGDHNGMPTIWITYQRSSRYAPRALLSADVRDGQVHRLYVVLHPRKLAGVQFGADAPA